MDGKEAKRRVEGASREVWQVKEMQRKLRAGGGGGAMKNVGVV